MKSANERLARAFVPLWAVAALLAVGLPSVAQADKTVADHTRINIDIQYDGQMGWHLASFDDFSGDPYEANEVLLYASAATRETVPDDPEFAFLGVAPGSTVWVLPQAFDPSKLSMSGTTESIAAGTFASYYESDPRVQHTAPWVKLTLKAVHGPGDMAVWQDDRFGHPVVWMATADGITDDDAIFIQLGLDADFTFAFTAPGLYHVKLQASAYLPGQADPIHSDVTGYSFRVANAGHHHP
jgi:surface-anchored protein